MTGNEINNIQVYRKKWNKYRVIIFGVIFVYLVVTVLMYATAKHVSSYEVREGSILKDTSYTGLVLRGNCYWSRGRWIYQLLCTGRQ